MFDSFCEDQAELLKILAFDFRVAPSTLGVSASLPHTSGRLRCMPIEVCLRASGTCCQALRREFVRSLTALGGPKGEAKKLTTASTPDLRLAETPGAEPKDNFTRPVPRFRTRRSCFIVAGMLKLLMDLLSPLLAHRTTHNAPLKRPWPLRCLTLCGPSATCPASRARGGHARHRLWRAQGPRPAHAASRGQQGRGAGPTSGGLRGGSRTE